MAKRRRSGAKRHGDGEHDLRQLEQLVHRATVVVTTPGKKGTGFFVDSEHVVTAAHTLTQGPVMARKPMAPLVPHTEIRVTWFDGEGALHDLKVLAIDEDLRLRPDRPRPVADSEDWPDVAVLRVDVPAGLDTSRLELGDRAAVTMGSPVYTFGYPLDQSKGAPAALQVSGLHANRLSLSSGRIVPGFSGAPVFSLRASRVIGVITHDRPSQEMAWAVAVDALLQHSTILRGVPGVPPPGDAADAGADPAAMVADKRVKLPARYRTKQEHKKIASAANGGTPWVKGFTLDGLATVTAELLDSGHAWPQADRKIAGSGFLRTQVFFWSAVSRQQLGIGGKHLATVEFNELRVDLDHGLASPYVVPVMHDGVDEPCTESTRFVVRRAGETQFLLRTALSGGLERVLSCVLTEVR